VPTWTRLKPARSDNILSSTTQGRNHSTALITDRQRWFCSRRRRHQTIRTQNNIQIYPLLPIQINSSWSEIPAWNSPTSTHHHLRCRRMIVVDIREFCFYFQN
jgi:hypothetical protein